MSRRFVTASIVVLVCSVAHQTALAQDRKYAHEFHHDFRGKPLPEGLHIVGEPLPEFLKEEPEGYRIALPKTWIHKFGGVGFRTNFKTAGDFEITAAFEILKAEVPPKGYGVGVTLRAQLVQPKTHGGIIARVVRGGGVQRVIWERGPDENNQNKQGVADCKETLLRLRLKREGDTLLHQWAAGVKGDEFTTIRMDPTFGADDINAVRLSVITGQQPCDVDVRFLDMRIGSGGMIAAQDDKQPAPVAPAPNQFGQDAAAPKTKAWLIALAAAGGGLLLLILIGAIVVVALKRRRSGALKASDSDFVNFSCAGCGKNLKTKAAAAGKKIKCTQCGAVAVVPGAEIKEA